ncbi:hypothetical protein [Clostridium sp. KNHs205]|uniref:hypothetical protein n=1 Tax=Clostridium sp. KNHs205 TaxID=1449050 RepID=UPI00051C94B4|nr:hypothetical protein [Clostridium sp. KNHs205]
MKLKITKKNIRYATKSDDDNTLMDYLNSYYEDFYMDYSKFRFDEESVSEMIRSSVREYEMFEEMQRKKELEERNITAISNRMLHSFTIKSLLKKLMN